MGPGDVNALAQRRQAVENAKAQLASITARTQVTTECIGMLVEAGERAQVKADFKLSDEPEYPLLVALCKVQLAQLRMAESEGLAAIQNLTQFIKASENPLFGATLIPPMNKTPGRH